MTHVHKTFFNIVVGLIFLAGGILHAYRAALGFDLMYGDYLVPLWVSWLIVLVALILALNAFRNLT